MSDSESNFLRNGEELQALFKSISNKENLNYFMEKFERIFSNSDYTEGKQFLDPLIEKTKKMKEYYVLLKLYRYKMIDYFTNQMKLENIFELLSEVKNIAERYNQEEGWGIYYLCDWLYNKGLAKREEAFESLKTAYEIMNAAPNPKKDNTYYTIKYTYAFDLWVSKYDHKAEKEFKDCLEFYKNNNYYVSTGKILNNLIGVYQHRNNFVELNKTLNELKSSNVIAKMPLSAQIHLYSRLGNKYLMFYDLEEAEYCYEKVLTSYQNIDIFDVKNFHSYCTSLYSLARIQAINLKFDDALDKLNHFQELFNNPELKRIPEKFLGKIKEYTYLMMNLTLLYIFTHLDKKIDEELYEYIKANPIAFYFTPLFIETLALTGFDPKDIDLMTKEDLKRNKNAKVFIQLVSEINSSKLNKQRMEELFGQLEKRDIKDDDLRGFIYKTNMDVMIAKLYIADGRNDEFKKIVKSLQKNRERIKLKSLLIWLDLFEILLEYIEIADADKAIDKIDEILEECRNLEMLKLEKEINYFKLFISGRNTVKKNENLFKQALLTDLYDSLSEERAIKFLERRKENIKNEQN